MVSTLPMTSDTVDHLQPKLFALVGAGGYIAPRHLRAIKDTGNILVAAVDPHDSVGVLDSFFPNARFFTEIERFDRHLEKLRRKNAHEKIDYVSICSPNYLHDAHVRLALRVHAHAICEKPLVINPWNLKPLIELESETGCRVYTILQLRLLENLKKLKSRIETTSSKSPLNVELTYITRRGAWYGTSWKGNEEKSGGLAVNIGIHLFDLILWIFGKSLRTEVHLRQKDRLAGLIETEKARITWFLSINGSDLPSHVISTGAVSIRSMYIEGEQIEFTDGFTELHTRSYEEILAGRGFGIAEALNSIELVYALRNQKVSRPLDRMHPLLDSNFSLSVPG